MYSTTLLPDERQIVLRNEWVFLSKALFGIEADLEGVERMLIQDPDNLHLWESRAKILEHKATAAERYEELLGMLGLEEN